jgi:predicted DNA binding CopG/RHH family protein
MARPKTINPKGQTRRVTVVLSDRVVTRIEKEAKKRGRSFGSVVRELLERGEAA